MIFFERVYLVLLPSHCWLPLCTAPRRRNESLFILDDAVGCIQVYLYDTVLLLRAAKEYPVPGRSGGSGDGAFVDEDPLAHITNTARQAEDKTFKEEDK